MKVCPWCGKETIEETEFHFECKNKDCNFVLDKDCFSCADYGHCKYPERCSEFGGMWRPNETIQK